jgi:hypothetical protein
MLIIAVKPIYNPRVYGQLAAGQSAEVPDHIARELIRGKLAIPLAYETKIITAAAPATYDVKEGTAAPPFRDGPGSDSGPAALVAVRAAVRAVSDVLAAGDSGGIQRGKHRRSSGGK